MSIEKFNPIISNEAIPYTQINTYVIQNISDMEAGFVWVYLLSKPENWSVIKTHVKNHFGIGAQKIKKIFSYLAKHGLIQYVRTRSPQGQLLTSEIRVLNGSQFNKDGGSTTGTEIHPVENHTPGKHTTTNKRSYKEKKNIKKERVEEPETTLSGFEPNKEAIDYAKQHNLNLQEELESFDERHRGKFTQYEFMRWLKYAQTYQNKLVSKKSANAEKQINSPRGRDYTQERLDREEREEREAFAKRNKKRIY